jgi:hypothetical protein
MLLVRKNQPWQQPYAPDETRFRFIAIGLFAVFCGTAFLTCRNIVEIEMIDSIMRFETCRSGS